MYYKVKKLVNVLYWMDFTKRKYMKKKKAPQNNQTTKQQQQQKTLTTKPQLTYK